MNKSLDEPNDIYLPKNSYTAFRLRYCDALELYNTSTVIFLGNIPPVWLLDKKSILLAKIHRLDTIKSHEKKHIERKVLDYFENAIPKDDISTNLNKQQNQTIDSSKFEKNKNKLNIDSLFNDNLIDEKDSNNSELKINKYLEEFKSEHNNFNLINIQTTQGKIDMRNNIDSIRKKLNRHSFQIPRLNIQSENIYSHHYFNSALNLSSNSEDDTNLEKFDKNNINESSTHDKNDVNDSKDNLDNLKQFLEKPIYQRQEILKHEINEAMLALRKHTFENDTHINTDEIELNNSQNESDESFVTASEFPLSLTTNSNNIDKEDENFKSKKVSFTPDQPHLQLSHKIPIKPETNKLQKTEPIPFFTFQNLNSNEFNHIMNVDVDNGSSLDTSTDIDTSTDPDFDNDKNYFTLNKYQTEDYNNWKSKSIEAKLGLTELVETSERKKRLQKILEHYQTGEIIKMEKMLVSVSLIEKYTLNSDSKTSSRTLERWKEYIVVIRATDNIDYPAIIQFYKTNKIFKKDEVSNIKNEIYEHLLESEISDDEYVDTEEHEIDESEKDDKNTTLRDDADLNNLTLKKLMINLKDKEPKNSKKNNKNKILTKKVLKKKEKIEAKKKGYDFVLVLGRNDTTVTFANLLDKSIRISKQKRKCTIEYTLLAHSLTSAIVCLSILRQLLFSKSVKNCPKSTISINIPTLNVAFTILGAKTLFHSLIEEKKISSDFIIAKFKSDGYQFPKIETFEKLLDMIVKQIEDLEEANKIPKNHAAQSFISKMKYDRTFLALTFRKYDRLEWILGENESLVEILWNIFGSSYELELREFQHEAHLLADGSLIEPLPIEGFVVKLSNRKGKLTSTLGKQYYKLLYAFTVENLLFFQNFYHAVPIFPSSQDSARHYISPAGDVLDLKKLQNAVSFKPTVYRSVVYPKTENHIEWLTPSTDPTEYYEKDADALYGAERRACMISNVHAVVDLCKITDIRLVPENDINVLIKGLNNATWDLNKDKTKLGIQDDEIYENCFELKFQDGSILRLQVCNKSIRNEWAKNLGKLSEYWTLKRKEDLVRHILLKEKNLSLMSCKNENYESLVAKENETSCSKWELSRAYTDSQLYSISSYVLDKPVLMEGYIYCKKFKSKQYETFYAVLSPGFLILYEIFNRSKLTRTAKPSTYYLKYATISLASCYVFSSTGKINPQNRSQLFFDTSSSLQSLPRVYGDGWRSSESQNERSFTLWFGSKTIMMRNISKQKGTELNSDEGGKSFLSAVHEVQSTTDAESEESDQSDREDKGNKKKMKFSNFKKKRKELKMQSTFSDSDGYDAGGSDSEAYSDPETSADEQAEYQFDKNKFDESVINENEKASLMKMFRTITRLGVKGKALEFLARSRIERDLWVTRLMTEVERFSGTRHNDIELV
jgi:hypothetical protein